MNRTITGLAALILLAGCAGADSAGRAVEPAAAETRPTTLTAMADTIGCTGYADASADSPLTKTYATCELPGGAVQLYEFGTPEVMDNFWTVSKEFGATPEQAATVGLLVAYPQAADLPAVKAALGQ